ncbi:hypothetical protein FHX77_001213 [Bifidobacterium commune]|uniref:Uncharacterized protein n=1 Tax=Bifidobacterium commune TaxID=1505727 RepID=A0A1C4H567_9BIFI|nr:hypothetical protein [Bifidobacterium commune]MBB2955781.1 hypothetical protein [Bifidobacterium commune]SCC80056.1 hypothetical protein GA0061077_0969 [Bifidobacterium commune]
MDGIEETQTVSPERTPASEPGSKDGRPERRTGRTALIALIACAVLAAAGVGGWFGWSHHETTNANADCARAVAEVSRIESKGLDDQVRQAAAVKSSDVRDGNTVTDLDATLKTLKAKPSLPSCDAAKRADARRDADAARDALAKLTAARRTAASRAKAVLSDRDAKTLDSLRADLTARRDQARQLLDSTGGAVADDATRTALSAQIDNATRLLDDKTVKADDLTGAAKGLGDATDAVNASVRAKADADAQAAAAAQAQAQSAPSSRSPRQGSPSGSSSGSGRGSRAPRPSAPSSGSAGRPSRPSAPAPRPSAPSGGSSNNGGDFDWNAWVSSHPANDDAGCVGGNRGCPIG